jgi:D-alanyl-D-alanine carboxypeptidase
MKKLVERGAQCCGLLAISISALLALAQASTGTGGSQEPRISPLSNDMKKEMTGKSWNSGCPVSLEDLSAVHVTYFGFDSATHEGVIVVHRRFAKEALAIFNELYAIRFPINKVAPWEQYGPDVYAEKDITVGYYCRKADDAPDEWSGHAYGVAIDINPLDNPFRNAKTGWWPSTSVALVPRDGGKGKISPNTEAFRIFAHHGWAWGGFYVGEPDLMHFYKETYGGTGNVLERPYVVTGFEYTPGGAMEAAQPKQ